MKVILEEKDVTWIVNNLGELGVKIGKKCFFLYKGESLEYKRDNANEAMRYRLVGKREFGEVCRPPHLINEKPETSYTEGDGWKNLT
jgi:hypothetical protein